MASVVEADLAELKRADAKAGVGMKFAHRLFDARWLRSPSARFQLTGVVNRIDRRVFHPGTCGEVRFLYRLAYAKKTPKGVVASRLPMTVNLVFWQQPQPQISAGDCSALARRWMAPAGAGGERPRALGARRQGPLRLPVLTRARLKSLEINLQSERWPSAVRPDMGGHAAYLLRVFHPVAGAERLEVAPLENVPDVPRLRKDAGLRAEARRLAEGRSERARDRRRDRRHPREVPGAAGGVGGAARARAPREPPLRAGLPRRRFLGRYARGASTA